jgi:hypothetical protein
MKVYHWILLLLTALIVWGIWVVATTPFMTVNGISVYDGYDYLKKELLNQPNIELYDEDTPIVPMGDYKFILSQNPFSIKLESIDSLSHQDYLNVVEFIAKDYRVEPILEGHESFFRLYNRERERISEYNQNWRAFSDIIGVATDYGDGALFELDKYNYIFIGYTSNYHTDQVHILYYVLYE